MVKEQEPTKTEELAYAAGCLEFLGAHIHNRKYQGFSIKSSNQNKIKVIEKVLGILNRNFGINHNVYHCKRYTEYHIIKKLDFSLTKEFINKNCLRRL